MVRFDRREVSVRMDYLNVPQASSKGGTEAVTGKFTTITSVHSLIVFMMVIPSQARNVYKLVGVSLGLLCVLQAALNISLRLTSLHSASKKEEIATDATCTNSTQETEELKRKIYTIDRYGQKGWVYFLSSAYYISSTTRTWFDSRAACLSRGADLVVINSREEQKFVMKFNKPLWIGLKEQEGTWKWVDGSQLKTSYWASNEPNNHDGAKEDCVQIRFPEINNSWNDVICEAENFWICEKTFRR